MGKKKEHEQGIDSTIEKTQDNSMQEKYMEMQMMEQQLKQLQKYVEHFDEQLSGVKGLIDAIKEFGNLKKGDNIYAPLANGIFAKAKLEDAQHLLINVGNNVVVSKTIADAIKLLEGQEAEVRQFRCDTMAQLDLIVKKMQELE